MSTLAIRYDADKTFHMTSGPAGAAVDSSGNIDLSSVTETDVDISWTLNDGKTFRTSANADPVTISGNGKDQIFTGGTLSNENKTYTVTDANAAAALNKSFTYQMHESTGDVDPSITNRN